MGHFIYKVGPRKIKKRDVLYRKWDQGKKQYFPPDSGNVIWFKCK